MAHHGWDSLVVDMQHGVIDYQTMVTMLQGISTTETVPMVRVPWNDPAHIQKALDAGAYGIICPMINTRAEAERFVDACAIARSGIAARDRSARRSMVVRIIRTRLMTSSLPLA